MNKLKEFRFAPQKLNYQTDISSEENKLLRGYALVFNSESELLSSKTGNFREVIPSNCKISFDDTRALWNHNDDLPLGAAFNGTLQLRTDKTGVYFELSPDRLTPAMLQTIQLGEARMSFGFFANDFESRVNKAGESLRILTDITVFEVSPVIFPAYSSTNVVYRSIPDDEMDSLLANNSIEESNSLDFVRAKLRIGLGVLNR